MFDLDLSKLGGYIDLVDRVLEDPYLDDVLRLGQQLADAETGPGGNRPGEPGVGLEDAIFPLKAALLVRRNPWVPYVAVAGAFLVPFLLGVLAGRTLARP